MQPEVKTSYSFEHRYWPDRVGNWRHRRPVSRIIRNDDRAFGIGALSHCANPCRAGETGSSMERGTCLDECDLCELLDYSTCSLVFPARGLAIFCRLGGQGFNSVAGR